MGDGSNDVGEMEGGFWSNIAKKSNGANRLALDQARMQLIQQLLAAMLNRQAFGAVDGGVIAAGEAAYCRTVNPLDPAFNTVAEVRAAVLSAAGALATFNEGGESVPLPPGFLLPTDPKSAKAAALKSFWDTLP